MPDLLPLVPTPGDLKRDGAVDLVACDAADAGNGEFAALARAALPAWIRRGRGARGRRAPPPGGGGGAAAGWGGAGPPRRPGRGAPPARAVRGPGRGTPRR